MKHKAPDTAGALNWCGGAGLPCPYSSSQCVSGSWPAGLSYRVVAHPFGPRSAASDSSAMCIAAFIFVSIA
jgi:hypothetical protein